MQKNNTQSVEARVPIYISQEHAEINVTRRVQVHGRARRVLTFIMALCLGYGGFARVIGAEPSSVSPELAEAIESRLPQLVGDPVPNDVKALKGMPCWQLVSYLSFVKEFGFSATTATQSRPATTAIHPVFSGDDATIALWPLRFRSEFIAMRAMMSYDLHRFMAGGNDWGSCVSLTFDLGKMQNSDPKGWAAVTVKTLSASAAPAALRTVLRRRITELAANPAALDRLDVSVGLKAMDLANDWSYITLVIPDILRRHFILSAALIGENLNAIRLALVAESAR